MNIAEKKIISFFLRRVLAIILKYQILLPVGSKTAHSGELGLVGL